jgi:hypothetical protein
MKKVKHLKQKQNFSLIYIKLAVPRLESAQKADIVEHLLNALPGKSVPHQDSLVIFHFKLF